MRKSGGGPASGGARQDDGSTGRRGWLTEAFTQRLGLKATAVGLAILLWFIITVKEPTVEYVEARFIPVLDSSLVMREDPPPIIVAVTGTPADVVRLRARPPVIRPQINADSPDTLVLDLKPSDVQVPDGVRVERIEPSSVTLRFEPTWTRNVPVRSEVRVSNAAGSSPRAVIVEPDRVEISGPRLAVLRTMFVRTEATVIAADDSLPHLVSIDTAGLGVRPSPAQVKVRLVTPGDSVVRR